MLSMCKIAINGKEVTFAEITKSRYETENGERFDVKARVSVKPGNFRCFIHKGFLSSSVKVSVCVCADPSANMGDTMAGV